MYGNDVNSNDNNSKINLNVLPAETVNSIFMKWRQNYFNDQAELNSQFNSIIEVIKKITPADVENKNIPEELHKFVTEMSLATEDRPEIMENLYNNLNLCIVGLGTRLKLYNHE